MDASAAQTMLHRGTALGTAKVTIGGDMAGDANLIFYSGTSFKGTLDHANTADRVYTFPDASITVIGEATAKKDFFTARMQRDSTTQISLQRYGGDDVEINGELVDPGSGGIACLTTDNLLSSTGTDSGGGHGGIHPVLYLRV